MQRLRVIQPKFATTRCPVERTVRLNNSRSQPKQFSVHRRGGRVIEDVNANMLQGIMQSASECESGDEDEESDEDEAKKPATSGQTEEIQ